MKMLIAVGAGVAVAAFAGPTIGDVAGPYIKQLPEGTIQRAAGAAVMFGPAAFVTYLLAR